jgi:undecaprenyl-diphosphatase
MIEKLNRLDTELFLWLNARHNSFFDPIMYWASHKLFWIPFYAILLFIIIREYKKKSIYILASIALLITLCDQTASHLIKQSVRRLRPSHEPALEGIIHLSKAGPGGQFGFVSSHAANAFGLAIFLILLLPKKYRALKWILLFWATLVAYSRIYVGVHYPGDVIAAGILGAALAYCVYRLYFFITGKIHSSNGR